MPTVALWRQTKAQPAQKSHGHISAAWLLPTSRASYFRLRAVPCSAMQHFVWPYSELGELASFCKELFEHPWNIPARNCTFVSRPWVCLLCAQPSTCSQGFSLLALLACHQLMEAPQGQSVKADCQCTRAEHCTRPKDMCLEQISLQNSLSRLTCVRKINVCVLSHCCILVCFFYLKNPTQKTNPQT